MKFKIGEYVYYVDEEGNTLPCKVIEIRKDVILISCPCFFIGWVSPNSCTSQEEIK